jgi:hypothetical protein
MVAPFVKMFWRVVVVTVCPAGTVQLFVTMVVPFVKIFRIVSPLLGVATNKTAVATAPAINLPVAWMNLFIV